MSTSTTVLLRPTILSPSRLLFAHCLLSDSCPDASQEEIEEAARRANAYDFIDSFPDKFDTYIGERGNQLVSAGQRQRIAIARAILKPKQIIVFDEATSALDSESEQLVQDALDRLMRTTSQTAIVIAHRLSTLRNADRIAVIGDGGKVTEIGTHDELMSKQNGHFKRLSMFQSLAGDNTEMESLMATAMEEENKTGKDKDEEVETECDDNFHFTDGDSTTDKTNVQRARLLAKDDCSFFIIGGIGALLAGLGFPATGVSLNSREHYCVLLLHLESKTKRVLSARFQSFTDPFRLHH